MIERYYSCFTAVCDYCGKRLPGIESFKDTLRDMRDAAWELSEREWALPAGREGQANGASLF